VRFGRARLEAHDEGSTIDEDTSTKVRQSVSARMVLRRTRAA
jgi:hypothetical protein